MSLDGPLASTDWLAERLDDPTVRIVDGTWFLPTDARNGLEEYRKQHILGAVFIDIEAVSDTSSSLPHMLPSAESFADAVGKLGISHTDQIVCYDVPGLFSAARVWWMFRVMGAKHVYVLDGGLARWLDEGRPVTPDLPDHHPTRFEASLDTKAVAALEAVQDASASGSAQIADARPSGRFRGDVDEPRPGLPSGHIPGSSSVPLNAIQENGRLKSTGELRALFEEAGIDLDRPIITSCGSGVTAAALTLALARLGVEADGLYDGSWTEWAGHHATEIATAADKAG